MIILKLVIKKKRISKNLLLIFDQKIVIKILLDLQNFNSSCTKDTAKKKKKIQLKNIKKQIKDCKQLKIFNVKF